MKTILEIRSLQRKKNVITIIIGSRKKRSVKNGKKPKVPQIYISQYFVVLFPLLVLVRPVSLAHRQYILWLKYIFHIERYFFRSFSLTNCYLLPLPTLFRVDCRVDEMCYIILRLQFGSSIPKHLKMKIYILNSSTLLLSLQAIRTFGKGDSKFGPEGERREKSGKLVEKF